jgi:hypothetical protein
MAGGTITISGLSAHNAAGYIRWSSDASNAAENYSIVNAYVYIKKTDSYTTWGTAKGTITINGVSSSYSQSVTLSTSYVLVGSQKNIKVKHTANGTKTIRISASVGISGTSLSGPFSAADDVRLDTISRISSLSSSASFTAGQQITLTISRYSSEFTHTAQIYIGNGIIYTLIYKYIVRKPKNIRNFPLIIFICDISSNMAEMTARCIVFDRMIFTVTIITSLFVIAFVRTILTQMVIIAIEAYSNFLVNKEHDAEYKKLLTQASIFEGELHVMEKNLVEIEDIMKKAYELHQSMSHIDAPKELQDTSLEIAKNAHEVKGDYMSVIGVLKETYVGGFGDKGMSIHDIVALERANVLSLIRSRGYHIDVSMKIKADFRVTKSFKMMSIIRNLLTNSAEAIGERGGRISISVTEVLDKKMKNPRVTSL